MADYTRPLFRHMLSKIQDMADYEGLSAHPLARTSSDMLCRISTQSGLSAAAPSESRLGEAVMDAEVANCSASKHGPGQSVKFLAAREHIDNQLYALDLCL
jgi:hypothetical protein